MPEEKRNDEETARFLKTNGPPPFHPQLPHFVLDGADERIKWLCERTDIGTQQNEWMMREIVGMKGSHRTIQHRLNEGDMRFQKMDQSIHDASLVAVQTVAEADARFKKIDQTLDTFSKFMPILEKLTAFWERWMGRRNLLAKVVIASITLGFMPLAVLIAYDLLKKWLGLK